MKKAKNKKIVVIGGGTGTYTVLSGLKNYNVDITAIVSVADSGGVAKVERDEFGILPNSDIRKAILALAQTNGGGSGILRDLFSYRFYHGVGLSGYTFGNFFLAALTDILKSQVKAIEYACKILKAKGRVLPVSLDNTNLLAEYEDGKKLLGEGTIDAKRADGTKKIVKLSLIPEAKIYHETKKAILSADLIIIGPGDLFTSIIANLLVDGVVEAIKKSKAKKAYIVNLIAKYGETYKFTATDHVNTLEKYLKSKPDYVLINSKKLPENIVKKYHKEKGYPVTDDLIKNDFKIIRGDFLAKMEVKKQKGDTLTRSMIRHDPDKLAKALISLLSD